MSCDSEQPLPDFELPADVDPKGWSLMVDGAVEQSLDLAATDLYDFCPYRPNDDFSCLERWTADNLNWGGGSIESLLSRARPTNLAAYGLVQAMDENYACGFELDRLRSRLLALELNDDRLLVEHGGPVRLVLSNEQSECYESVKWVTSIELLAHASTDRDTAAKIALERLN